MEGSPARTETVTERSHAETFGIEPSAYEREIPEAIRGLADALHRFEREAGEDDDIREEFRGIYPEGKIEAELAEVHRLERAYDAEDDLEKKKNRLYALALELIVQDMAHEWFPDCVIWRASRFDDYKRQTDLFMDIPDPEGAKEEIKRLEEAIREPGIDNTERRALEKKLELVREHGLRLTLALDVTASRDAANRKVDQVLTEMGNGQFHDVDYFASDIDPGRAKGRTFMPRFIVGAAKGSIDSLARLYGQWRRHGPTVGSRTKEQELDRLRFHQVGRELYEEMIHQAGYGHTSMRRLLKSAPTYQKTKRDALKAKASYLGRAQKELTRRFKELKRSAAAYEKANGPVPVGATLPPNGILDAVLQRTG